MPFRIVCPPERFNHLRNDRAFHRLMIAGKIANALRFSIMAAKTATGPVTYTSTRTRAASFHYVSALLQEALRFLPRLGQYYSGSPAFREELAPLLRDPTIASLQNGPLDRLRDHAVFHNDDVVMAHGLQNVALDEYVLVAGDTPLAGDVYFPLSDIAIVHHALSTDVQGYQLLGAMSVLLDQVADVGTKVCKGIDSLFREAVAELGCSYIEE